MKNKSYYQYFVCSRTNMLHKSKYIQIFENRHLISTLKLEMLFYIQILGNLYTLYTSIDQDIITKEANETWVMKYKKGHDSMKWIQMLKSKSWYLCIPWYNKRKKKSFKIQDINLRLFIGKDRIKVKRTNTVWCWKTFITKNFERFCKIHLR